MPIQLQYQEPLADMSDILARINHLSQVEAQNRFYGSHTGKPLSERIKNAHQALKHLGMDSDAALAIFACTKYLTYENVLESWRIAGTHLLAQASCPNFGSLVHRYAFFQCDGEDHIHEFLIANSVEGRNDPERFSPYNSVTALDNLVNQCRNVSKLDPNNRKVLEIFLRKDNWVLLWDLNLSGKTVAKELERLKRYAEILPLPQPIRIHLVCAVSSQEANRKIEPAYSAAGGQLLIQQQQLCHPDCTLLSSEWIERSQKLSVEFFDRILKSAGEHAILSYIQKNGTPYGFANGGWTLVTQRNCPNNTLPLFWTNIPGTYTGPFPRIPSRISHLSLAPKNLDNSTLQERRKLRQHVQTYLFVEGVIPQTEDTLVADDSLRHNLLERLFADAASSDSARWQETQSLVERLRSSGPVFLKLWEEYLDRCHRLLMEKVRDLKFLERVIALGHAAFTEHSEKLFANQPQLELLWQLSRVRVANHDGKTQIAELLQTRIIELEKMVKDEDPALVVHSILNRAVFATNKFDFEQVADIVAPWWQEDRNGGIPAALRGAMHSTLGQAYAFKGFHPEAEGCFVKAMFEFSKVGSASHRQEDSDQVAVYRAINAFDGRLPQSSMLLELVLGNDSQKIVSLATTVEPRYHHHLLIRILALNPTWRPDLARAYLGNKSRWSDDAHHPFPMINFYRALLLHQFGDNDATCWLSHAVEQALSPDRGQTVQMIGLVISVAGYHLGLIPKGDRVDHLIQELRVSLPATENRLEIISRLFSESPNGTLISEFSELLPFNFH